MNVGGFYYEIHIHFMQYCLPRHKISQVFISDMIPSQGHYGFHSFPVGLSVSRFLVYPMLPVSLDCPFLIAPSAVSNVYLLRYIRF